MCSWFVHSLIPVCVVYAILNRELQKLHRAKIILKKTSQTYIQRALPLTVRLFGAAAAVAV